MLSTCENITIGVLFMSGCRMHAISLEIVSRNGMVRIFFARLAGGSS
jgi:hypothetical protein